MARESRLYREVLLKKGKCLKPLILRALNSNQLLILSSIDGSCATPLLERLSEERRIPLSTLKLNARILCDLGLVEFKSFCPIMITDLGLLVLEITGTDACG